MSKDSTMGSGSPCPGDSLSCLAFDYLNAPEGSVQQRRLENQFYIKVKALATKYVNAYNKINPAYRGIVVDQVVERVFLKLHTFKFTSSVKTWTYSITRSTCLDFFRGRAFKESEVTNPIGPGDVNSITLDRQSSLDDVTLPQFIDHRTPEGVLLSEESAAIVRQAIRKLNEEDQEIITLIYLHGYSCKEVGGLYRLEQSNFSHRKKRILKKLKSFL